jgi:hypothetical protein
VAIRWSLPAAISLLRLRRLTDDQAIREFQRLTGVDTPKLVTGMLWALAAQ